LTIPWRRLGASAAALAVVAALAYSGWKDLPHTWRLLKTQHSAYAGYTAAQKERLFATSIPMSMDAFDFWRFYLQSRDRYYLQMPPEPFSSFANKRQIAQAIAHIYLLPATETGRRDRRPLAGREPDDARSRVLGPARVRAAGDLLLEASWQLSSRAS
jgi:hypothetical protein